MRNAWRLLALFVVVMIFLGPAQAGRQPSVDGETFRFSVHDLDGNVVTSDDERFSGKVVFFDLWGTWCPPCLTEIPTFNDLQARLGDRGLVVVGMAFERMADDEQRRKHLREFTREHGISYLVLDGGNIQDLEKVLPDLHDVQGFPIEITVGREGKVVETKNGKGYSRRWSHKLDRKLTALVEPSPEPE